MCRGLMRSRAIYSSIVLFTLLSFGCDTAAPVESEYNDPLSLPVGQVEMEIVNGGVVLLKNAVASYNDSLGKLQFYAVESDQRVECQIWNYNGAGEYRLDSAKQWGFFRYVVSFHPIISYSTTVQDAVLNIRITSVSSDRIAGTFSGSIVNEQNSSLPSYTITRGRFHIQYHSQ